MKIYIENMRKYLLYQPLKHCIYILQCTENNQHNPPIELDLSINEIKYIGENKAIYWLYIPILNYLTLS